MIEFIEVQSKESLGTVELTDGKLVGPVHLRSMIQAWMRQDKAPEEFMEFYSSWSNGYIESKAVEGKPFEDESPAEELRVAAFAQNDEELSPVTVIEKLRDLVAADVDADPARGYAGVEAKEQMENYLELITEAVTSGSEEDVRDIIEDVLEEVPVEDYDGAAEIVQFLKEFTGESDESDEPAETETLSVQKPRTISFPRPIKK